MNMAGLFWDPDYSSSPPQTPPPLNFSSEFRHSRVHSFYNSSSIEDGIDWPSVEQVEFTRLNSSRTKDRPGGEWHIVTATHSLLGRDRRGQREALLDHQSYNSLPRAHFLQPNRESSAFSPYNAFWLNGRDAKNIAESPRSRRDLHPLTQPGFYSPKIPRSKHCEAALSARKSLKGSSSTNNLKDFCALTLPLPSSKTAVLKPSPLCSKPQEVKTSVVEKPPLMRAVLSQTSPTSNQHGEEKVCHLQLRDDRPIKKQNSSFFNLQEHSRKPPTNGQLSGNQRQDLSTKDLLYINTHVFPERQSAASHPNLEKTSHENTDAEGDPERPCQLQTSPTQPDCSLKHKRMQKTQQREPGDVGNNEHNHVKSQVDVISRNVFGQPRVRASLRAACSPRPVRKSTVLEELKKLIVMDDTEDSAQADSSTPQQKEAGGCRSLPVSSSCASPSSPVLTPVNFYLQSECRELPVQVESDFWDGDQRPDSELMPLPSTACDLDWNSLVQAAQEYETQRMATFLSEMSPVPSRPDTPSHETYRIHQSPSPYCFEDDMDSDVFIDFPDQLSHLEGMLRRLSSDLLKEKRDKVALLAEVLKLRISNQHLREESLCAVAQLQEISKILNTAPEGTD